MEGSFYEAKRNKPYDRGGIRQQQYRFQFNGKRNLLLFNELIGFVNPKHQLKFDRFIIYDKIYLPKLRDTLNQRFMENMAALGVEPRTSSS